MTRPSYNALINRLGLDTAVAVAAFIGVHERQAYRYQAGTSEIPEAVMRLLILADAIGLDTARKVLRIPAHR